eukprot:CAMPEP_0184477244 /NCGR_PEP_ID=MMETSP0740-20130409/147498_1 /TAXON_ID=385413 /ORGANISM="Thalassiosira miniscula, Strain CCMP1093" /LENGTH=233 /DNA_ID=CAMNT_0026854825 /DNA_START=1397 /DNA_END=2095 /DNA_ORIENTATION=+
MIRRAHSVIALNRDQFDELENIGVSSSKCHLIPVSVAAEFRAPNETERQLARAKLGLKPEDWVVGSIGLICERKQQLTIVKALNSMSCQNAVLVLCGPKSGGTEADPIYAENCVKEAAKTGLRTIMTGHVDDVREIVWALDVFVLGSLSEGMPNALLEAMACGVPCVGSDISGVRQILGEHNVGMVFDPGNPESLQEVLVKYHDYNFSVEHVKQFRSDVVDKLITSLVNGALN